MNELMEYARQEKEMIDRLAGTLASGEELAKNDSFLACRCLRDYLEIAEGLETTPGIVNCLAQQVYAEFVKRYLSQVGGFLSALKRTGAFNAEAKEALAWLAATGMPLFEKARKAVADVREVGQFAVLIRILDYYDGMLDMTGEALAAPGAAKAPARPGDLVYDLIYDIPSCIGGIPSLLADISSQAAENERRHGNRTIVNIWRGRCDRKGTVRKGYLGRRCGRATAPLPGARPGFGRLGEGI